MATEEYDIIARDMASPTLMTIAANADLLSISIMRLGATMSGVMAGARMAIPFQQTNLAIGETSQKMVTYQGATNALIPVVEKMGKTAQLADVQFRQFGRSVETSSAEIPMIGRRFAFYFLIIAGGLMMMAKQGETYAKSMQELSKASGKALEDISVLTKSQAEKMIAAGGAADFLGKSFQSMGAVIMTAATPAFMILGNLLGWISEGLSKLPGFITKPIGSLIMLTLILSGVGLVSKYMGQFFSMAFITIKESVMGILPALGSMWGALTRLVTVNLASFFASMWAGFVSAATAAWAFLAPVIATVAAIESTMFALKGFAEFMATFGDAANRDYWKQFRKNLPEGSAIIASVKAIAGGIADATKDLMKTPEMEGVKEGFGDIGKGFGDIGKSVLEGFKPVMDAIDGSTVTLSEYLKKQEAMTAAQKSEKEGLKTGGFGTEDYLPALMGMGRMPGLAGAGQKNVTMVFIVSEENVIDSVQKAMNQMRQ